MEKILIVWDDSNIIHGWDSIDAAGEVAHCETVGFLIREDTDGITLAMSASTIGSVMERLTIPRGAIKSIRRLRIR